MQPRWAATRCTQAGLRDGHDTAPPAVCKGVQRAGRVHIPIPEDDDLRSVAKGSDSLRRRTRRVIGWVYSTTRWAIPHTTVYGTSLAL